MTIDEKMLVLFLLRMKQLVQKESRGFIGKLYELMEWGRLTWILKCPVITRLTFK